MTKGREILTAVVDRCIAEGAPIITERCNWTANDCLREYSYWIDQAREHAEGLGRESESYRAASQMAYRWLGRFDALSRLGK